MDMQNKCLVRFIFVVLVEKGVFVNVNVEMEKQKPSTIRQETLIYNWPVGRLACTCVTIHVNEYHHPATWIGFYCDKLHNMIFSKTFFWEINFGIRFERARQK